jgi:hypothetical protein
MNKHTMLLPILLVGCLLIGSCSQKPSYTAKTLPSGKVVKIAGIGKMSFSKDDPALMLKYYSDVSMNDTVKLQDEVEEIWSIFRIDAEQSKMNAAIISANEMPSGIISKTRSFNFVFKKEPSGEWILTNNQKPTPNNEVKSSTVSTH